jgi:hypothetical protein
LKFTPRVPVSGMKSAPPSFLPLRANSASLSYDG